MITRNINDDNTLSYLFNKTGKKASDDLGKAVGELEKEIGAIWNLIYPVGAIYLSTAETSPALLFGGSWSRIEDKFLLCAGETYEAGDSGGEAEHILTSDEMPSHTHNYAQYYGVVGWSASSPRNVVKINNTDGYTTTNNDGTLTTLPAGGDLAHNNMPPYLTVYAWERIE